MFPAAPAAGTITVHVRRFSLNHSIFLMKVILASLLFLVFSIITYAQKQAFNTSDIDNFWKAYDKIVSTKDSSKQLQYLRELYLDKASPGLKGLIEVRDYTEAEFLNSIRSYPVFWKSVRANTTNIKSLFSSIESNIKKLKKIYPALQPVPIYFAVGAFRTNGTIQGSKVLIGAELALADQTTITDELPEWRRPFYKEYNPRANIALLCTHEYIHTQQRPLVENLLSSCLYEGVAEFISCFATGLKSNSPAIAFGKANQQRVINLFVKDLYTMSNNYNWLWGQNRNELKVRDLGYYIGYEIAERYYNLALNKPTAIKELIELDYTNEDEVARIVDVVKLLPKPIGELYQDYEKSRPVITAITPFENGSDSVKPGLTKITVTFSEPLNGYNTGIDFGPLGETAIPKITPVRTWSADKRSWSFEAELQPDKHYQILISNNFRKDDGVRLKPYLIEFGTTGK